MGFFARLLTLGLLVTLAAGCAGHHFSVPREELEKSVKVLGVAPLLTDGDSDVRHPEKELLLGVVEEANRRNEKYLVERLRDTGTYFAVRLLTGDPKGLFQRLVERREKRDDAGVVYNKYFFRTTEIDSFLKEQGVDAVLVGVVNGLTRNEKLYAKNYLSYLQTDHAILAVTAAIVGSGGKVYWEYPNFRQRSPSLVPLIRLQYPAFEEAEANATDEVGLKYRTVAGIRRLLVPKEGYSHFYQDLFDEMASLQKRPVEWAKSLGLGEKRGAEEPSPQIAPAKQDK